MKLAITRGKQHTKSQNHWERISWIKSSAVTNQLVKFEEELRNEESGFYFFFFLFLLFKINFFFFSFFYLFETDSYLLLFCNNCSWPYAKYEVACSSISW